MNLRHHRTTAVAVGAVILVACSSMGAVAGSLVTGAQIKDQTIHSNDIATGGVGTSEIRDASILSRDLSQSTNGTNGVDGKPGTNGTDGTDGTDGVSGYEVKTWDYIAGKADTESEPGMGAEYNGAGSGGIATVACSPGKEAVGGGYWFRSANALTEGWSAVSSMPGRMDWDTNSPKPNRHDGWIVQLNAPQGANPVDMTMYVVCAKVTD